MGSGLNGSSCLTEAKSGSVLNDVRGETKRNFRSKSKNVRKKRIISFNKNSKHKHIIDSTKAEVNMRIMTNPEITRLTICLQFSTIF